MGIQTTDVDANATAPPLPGFEGMEKRLLVEFSHATNPTKDSGLRRLARTQISSLLTLAECNIVSELHNDDFDSYVLSESSLFIYPLKIVLKTCGRTQLLKCIPLLLSFASCLSLKPSSCKYTHGTFIFPRNQPYPYGCFEDEVKELDDAFGDAWVGGRREVRTMGKGQQRWYIFSAVSSKAHLREPIYTLEICMTSLGRGFASNFMNVSGTKTGKDMTLSSGIGNLLPNAQLCDFAFAPCGYSMNGMEGRALSTIHITPEDAFSYGSFEIMGYDPLLLNFKALVKHVVSCFEPGKVAMSLHVSGSCNGVEPRDCSWASAFIPFGYVSDCVEMHELRGDGVVFFHAFHNASNHLDMDPFFEGNRNSLLVVGKMVPCAIEKSLLFMDACYMEASFMTKLGWKNVEDHERDF